MRYDVTNTLGLLKQARAELRKRKWVKGAFFFGGTENCPEGVCMAGALNLAAHGYASTRPRWGLNKIYNAHSNAYTLLVKAAGESAQIPHGLAHSLAGVGAFNDYYCKTKKQAIEVFNRAIELEEERIADLTTPPKTPTGH